MGIAAPDKENTPAETDHDSPVEYDHRALFRRFGSSRLVWGDEALVLLVQAGMNERTYPASHDAGNAPRSPVSAAVAGRDP